MLEQFHKKCPLPISVKRPPLPNPLLQRIERRRGRSDRAGKKSITV
jgi:hypothetical protein